MKHLLKILGLFIVSYVVSNILVFYALPDSIKLVERMTAPILGVEAGLLIGAVGVFLGSLGNLYAVLKTNTNAEESYLTKLADLLKNISKTVDEVKQDVFFVLAVLGIILLLPLLRISNIPNVNWPFQSICCSKPIVFSALNLCLTFLSFVAVFDCVNAMFLLHKHYEIAITKGISNDSKKRIDRRN